MEDLLRRIGFRGVDKPGRAQRHGLLPLVLLGLNDNDLGGGCQTAKLDHDRADGAHSDDRHRFSQLDIQQIHAVQTARKRLRQRGVPKAQGVRNFVDIFLGRTHIVRHSLHDAFGIFAHMGQPVPAEPAFSAAPVGVDGHPVSRTESRDGISHRFHDPGHLVSQRNRQLQRA